MVYAIPEQWHRDAASASTVAAVSAAVVLAVEEVLRIPYL
jgi:hypothetical protein